MKNGIFKAIVSFNKRMRFKGKKKRTSLVELYMTSVFLFSAMKSETQCSINNQYKSQVERNINSRSNNVCTLENDIDILRGGDTNPNPCPIKTVDKQHLPNHLPPNSSFDPFWLPRAVINVVKRGVKKLAESTANGNKPFAEGFQVRPVPGTLPHAANNNNVNPQLGAEKNNRGLENDNLGGSNNPSGGSGANNPDSPNDDIELENNLPNDSNDSEQVVEYHDSPKKKKRSKGKKSKQNRRSKKRRSRSRSKRPKNQSKSKNGKRSMSQNRDENRDLKQELRREAENNFDKVTEIDGDPAVDFDEGANRRNDTFIERRDRFRKEANRTDPLREHEINEDLFDDLSSRKNKQNITIYDHTSIEELQTFLDWLRECAIAGGVVRRPDKWEHHVKSLTSDFLYFVKGKVLGIEIKNIKAVTSQTIKRTCERVAEKALKQLSRASQYCDELVLIFDLKSLNKEQIKLLKQYVIPIIKSHPLGPSIILDFINNVPE